MKKLKFTNSIYLLKDKKVNTISFNLLFIKDKEKEDSNYLNLLSQIVTNTSKKYKTIEEFKNKKLDNFILVQDLLYRNCERTTIINYYFNIPKENILDGYDIVKSFNFAMSALFEPNIKNNTFDKKIFKYELNYLKERHKRVIENKKIKNKIEYYNYIDPTEQTGISYETSGKILEQITNEKLYKYYIDNIVNKNYILFVHGDITEEKIKKLFRPYKKFNNKELTYNVEYNNFLKLNKYSEQTILSETKQSSLFLLYQVDNMKDSDKPYFRALCEILDKQENRLLFKKIRTENSLAYDIHVESAFSNGFFTVVAFADSNKKEKIIKLTKEVIESLKNKVFLNECLERLKYAIKIEILKDKDSQSYKYNYMIDKKLKFITYEKYLNQLNKLDINKFIKFIDRIKLTTVFLCKGEN